MGTRIMEKMYDKEHHEFLKSEYAKANFDKCDSHQDIINECIQMKYLIEQLVPIEIKLRDCEEKFEMCEKCKNKESFMPMCEQCLKRWSAWLT